MNTTKKMLQIKPAQALTVMWLAIGLCAVGGCGGGKAAQKQNNEFFTSGSRDADQRAAQRMAKNEQLAGSGEGSGEKGAKAAKANGDGTNSAAQVEGKLSLYERLGKEAGISNIVADFLPRVLQDPRVNWQRKGVTQGGLSIHHDKAETWNSNPQNVATLQTHLAQFLSLATGGPSLYQGRDLKGVHAHMHIANVEFDSALGDLKASLDKLKIPNREQKELLSIVESTRPEIVTER